VVLVSKYARQVQSWDTLLAATVDYDVIVVESIARSYSCIMRVVPDMVIISSEVDDTATCQLLSKLRVNRRLSGIPVLARQTFREHHDSPDDLVDLDEDMSTGSLAPLMN
jgi:hypothetical protein